MLVNKKVAEHRYSICKTCDKFNSFKFCNECLCLIPAKVVWSDSECPLGKWTKSSEDPTVKDFYIVKD